jgi:hypothetical protein
MFLDNKYTKYYYQIIDRAKNRVLDEYTEMHHIIPKSLGGTNLIDNLVRLTAREHVICHMLLTKMTLNRYKAKMVFALWSMITMHNEYHRRYCVTARQYENIKKQMAKQKSAAQQGELNHFFKKTHTEETKRKIREKRIGCKDSLETKNKKSIAGKKRPPVTEKTREKLRVASTGRPGLIGEKNGFYGKQHSLEQREKKRAEKLAAPKLTCYYCSKQVDPMNYGRWHGKNCKQGK